MKPLQSLEQLEDAGWVKGQILEQQRALNSGVDLSNLDPTIWDAFQLMQQRQALVKDVDLSHLNIAQLRWEQMEAQRLALSEGRDLLGTHQEFDWASRAPKQVDGRAFSGLDPTKWTAGQMRWQHFAVVMGFDLANLDPCKWTWEQMAEQLRSLEDGVDASHLDPEKLSCEEMSLYRCAIKRNGAYQATAVESTRPSR